MNRKTAIAIIISGVLAGGLAGFGGYRVFCAHATGYDSDPVLKVIFGRKSVRHFTDRKVPRDALDLLVKAGMAAPSALNKQPWAFVVATDRAILDRLAAALPFAKMLSRAGAAIVVCGIPAEGTKGAGSEYWVMDCSAATENILLAAEASGLGAVWTAAYPSTERVASVREILGIPGTVVPLNVIPVGYPTGEDLPKDKYRPENVHWDRW
ncbi:MAG: nitroreductase family protein [Spirochaetes bacterium]|nr:MAG: nitroreductase family protein [Spirochaetota bacterium]